MVCHGSQEFAKTLVGPVKKLNTSDAGLCSRVRSCIELRLQYAKEKNPFRTSRISCIAVFLHSIVRLVGIVLCGLGVETRVILTWALRGTKGCEFVFEELSAWGGFCRRDGECRH